MRNAGQVPRARQVGDCRNERDTLALFAQGCADIIRASGERAGQCSIEIACIDHRHQVRVAVDKPGKKRAVCTRACDRIGDGGHIKPP